MSNRQQEAASSAPNDPGPDRWVREPERRRITGLSNTTWWRGEKAGTAPKRTRISANCVAWRLSQLLAWNEAQAEAGEIMSQPEGLREHQQRRHEAAEKRRELAEAVP